MRSASDVHRFYALPLGGEVVLDPDGGCGGVAEEATLRFAEAIDGVAAVEEAPPCDPGAGGGVAMPCGPVTLAIGT